MEGALRLLAQAQQGSIGVLKAEVVKWMFKCGLGFLAPLPPRAGVLHRKKNTPKPGLMSNFWGEVQSGSFSCAISSGVCH